MIEDNTRHVQKIYHEHHYFDRVLYLIIKFIVEIQNYAKTNDEKIIKYFSIDYDVHYNFAKTKMINCIMV
jgi:hypothetical protein